jgi:hypothetical protein
LKYNKLNNFILKQLSMAKKDIELDFASGANNSEKLKALQAAMDKIEKSFGKGSIMKLGDEKIQDVEVIPTGSIALNYALGVGGYPKGRIIEIYGPESSGKTTLAIHAIAEAQKAGGIAAFIDAEHAFDRFYAAKLGVDVDNVWISQPDNGEQALEITETMVRSGAIDIVIVDSCDETDRKQAARQTFAYQRHLKTYAPAVPEDYLERWLTADECRELAEIMCVPETSKTNSSRVMTWNKLKDFLPAIGYTYEKKRKTIQGKQQIAYYITGEWKDAKIEDGNFMALVAAKAGT